MTETGSSANKDKESTQGPGKRLLRERRARKLTVHDVSVAMHIDKHIIRDIEDDRFDDYLPIYVTGYLRKYAKLLELPGDELVAEYQRINDSAPPALSATVAYRQVRSDHKLVLYITYLIVTVFLGMLIVWWFGNIDTDDQVARNSSTSQSIDANTENTDTSFVPLDLDVKQQPGRELDVPANEPDPASDNTPVVIDRAAATARETTVPTPEIQAVPAGSDAPLTSLSLHFREDSWAEVTDALGNRKLFGLYKSGQVVEVSGAVPIDISLGNAAGVEIKYNGKPYDFRSQIRDTGTARFIMK